MDRSQFLQSGRGPDASGNLGSKEQLGGIQLRRSNFIMRDQTLNLQLSASHQKFDAYEAKTVLLAGNIERQSNFIWQKKWTWSYGAQLLATDEQGVFSPAGLKDTRAFFIGAIPLTLGYDGSDSLLDPTRGFRLSGWISPEYSGHGKSLTYARSQIDASAYHPSPTRSSSLAEFGSVQSSAQPITTSRLRDVSIRAAAGRCGDTVISSSVPRTRKATPSAAAALRSSRSRRASA